MLTSIYNIFYFPAKKLLRKITSQLEFKLRSPSISYRCSTNLTTEVILRNNKYMLVKCLFSGDVLNIIINEMDSHVWVPLKEYTWDIGGRDEGTLAVEKNRERNSRKERDEHEKRRGCSSMQKHKKNKKRRHMIGQEKMRLS